LYAARYSAASGLLLEETMADGFAAWVVAAESIEAHIKTPNHLKIVG
jgi:hypothetical protein